MSGVLLTAVSTLGVAGAASVTQEAVSASAGGTRVAGQATGRKPVRPAKAAPAAPAREAALARIRERLAGHRRDAALEVYEAFVAQTGSEDLALLVLIARDHLDALAAAPETEVKVGALDALAVGGDARATAALVKLAAAGPREGPGLAATLALAGLRDRAALDEVRGLARTGPKGVRPLAIAALGDVDRSAASAFAITGLQDPDPMARMGYTELAARFGATSAVPVLQRMLADRNTPFLRLPAAAALRRLGDSSGDDILRQALNSPLPDARLIAARALAEVGDRSWVSVVSPILQDPDGLNRLNAAELLLPMDRGLVLATLKAAASDANPVVRAEAARVIALASPPDVPSLRALLTDKSDLVRLRAAGAVHAAARVGAGSAKGPGI